MLDSPQRTRQWDCTSRRWLQWRGDNKNTVDVPGGASPAPWLVGPPDNTSRLVSSEGPSKQWRNIWNGATTRERRRTWPAKRWQRCCGLPRPMSRSFISAIACLQSWRRLEPEWCSWWRAGLKNIIKSSWVSTFACSSRRTCNHQKDCHCGASSFCRQPMEFLERASDHHSSARASSGSLEKQANTTPAFHWTWHDISSCSPSCSSQRHTRRKTAPFSILVHARDKRNGKHVETALVSATENHAINPQTRRCERGTRCQRQKSGRCAETRRLEELQQCATLRKKSPLVPGYVQDPSRASPARTGTRTRPGTTLEKALTRALTGSTLSVGRVFPLQFSTQPVLLAQFCRPSSGSEEWNAIAEFCATKFSSSPCGSVVVRLCRARNPCM